jgi:hypothetical protein
MTNREDVTPAHGGGNEGDQVDATSATGDQHGDTANTRTRDRVVSRECAFCGTPVVYGGRGRPSRYCSASCRHRAWAIRQAERQLAAGADPRPRVVREVIERTTERVVVRRAPVTSWAVPVSAPATPAPAVPERARDWVPLLDELRGQLGDPTHTMSQAYWDHERLYQALLHAVTMLGQAHPGGLDRLTARHR